MPGDASSGPRLQVGIHKLAVMWVLTGCISCGRRFLPVKWWGGVAGGAMASRRGMAAAADLRLRLGPPILLLMHLP